MLNNLPWNEPPLSWLNAEEQNELKQQAEIHNYKLGEKIWSQKLGSDAFGKRNYQFFIVAGKVRLREEEENKTVATLQTGDWFGNCQPLFADCKAVAASKEVIVVCWNSALWKKVLNPQVNEFWNNSAEVEEIETILPVPNSPISSPSHPAKWEQPTISNYPFVGSGNTGAACLTMVAQYLQNPVQLEWVQRQLRGQKPKNLVEAGEKLGLVLRKLQVNWHELRQLTFPAVLLWNQGNQEDKNPQFNWVVAYGIKGNFLIIANPQNPDYI
ncbi:cysteine peptidase family C39 domain-containing protein, partial [Aphanizomenon sp. PH219]|nr:cysteine peptidase family C39 domain-containing protein [Aphanizomenon sp. PH219]